MGIIFLAGEHNLTDTFLLGKDMLPFMQWWLTVFILGIIFMPLSGLLFSKLCDKGYLFSKVVGIAVSGYIMWFMSSVKIMKFTAVSCVISAGIGLVINILILLFFKFLYKSDEKPAQYDKNLLSACFNKKTVRFFIFEELMFFSLFMFFTYIRCFKPYAYGTEKFMDYGFMTTMMRSDYMPPQDFWFSGTKLNYYYVGQFMAAFLTRLSFVNVSHGYNLMLMMVAAFGFVLPFSLGYNLIHRYGRTKARQSGFFAGVGGLLAGAAVCLAGNMHYPIYGLIIPTIRKLAGKENVTYHYWFPDATRYIGYDPETHDKTIHEFPAYSFVLGDLHAHVINIMFVLTVLAILLSWLYDQTDRYRSSKTIEGEVLDPRIIMLAFFIGLFHTTNYWDYPIYYVVSGAIILFSNMITYHFKIKAYVLTVIQGLFVISLAKLFALPFTLNFDKISGTVRIAENHTPFYQYMVLWGLPLFTVIFYISTSIYDYATDRKRPKKVKLKSRFKSAGRAIADYMSRLSETDLYIITIGLCAIGLIFLPEVVYVEDIYSGDYKRANTMFKLTYQAFIMFGICFGYIYVRVIHYAREKARKTLTAVSFALFCLTLLYPVPAVKGWYNNIFDRSGFKGVDATLFLEKDFKDDLLAIKWLNENITGTPVVLEANGLSYTEYQRVSVLTGLPTVLGWYTHEQLWKSQPGLSDKMVTSRLNERAGDIETIYTSDDVKVVRELINKYGISYIYVGQLEENKYGRINHELIKSLGEVVFENPDTDEYLYKTYIVRIDGQNAN